MKKSNFYKIYYLLVFVLCTSEVTNGWFWPFSSPSPPPKPKPRTRPRPPPPPPPPRPKPTISFSNIHEEFTTCEPNMKIKKNLLPDCIENCPHVFMNYHSVRSDTYNLLKGGPLKGEKCSACEKLFKERSENCDKIFDCNKRSKGAFCSRCSKDKFSCDGQVCIPKRWKCDQIVDCYNGADEKDCEFRNCTKNEFRCGNGRCIDQSLYCNGVDDCGDRSDEKTCAKTLYYADSFSCRNLQKLTDSNNFLCEPCLIPISWHSRWQVDFELRNCTKYEFRCGNSRCIDEPPYFHGVDDCGDQSDEKTCSETFDYPDSFLCRNLYIPSSWHCDGIVDCYNGLDEKNCPTAKNCTKNQFKCDNRKCIHVDSVCDGIADCWDRSDEKNCSKTKCPYNRFDCGDQCIPLQWRCDKRKDCLNLKDEMYCNEDMYKSFRLRSSFRCVDGTFPCADRSGCISNDFVCDKYPNCKDHSDEKNCPDRNDLV